VVVDAEKNEQERKRKRKTLLVKRKKCAQKVLDRADVVRDAWYMVIIPASMCSSM